MKTMICIVCPKGCHLTVDDSDKENIMVSGHSCARGYEYGKEEAIAPKRTVTSTVAVAKGIHQRLPVKTNHPIPKELVKQAVRLLDGIVVISPIQSGQVILADLLHTGADFVATRDLPEATIIKMNDE